MVVEKNSMSSWMALVMILAMPVVPDASSGTIFRLIIECIWKIHFSKFTDFWTRNLRIIVILIEKIALILNRTLVLKKEIGWFSLVDSIPLGHEHIETYNLYQPPFIADDNGETAINSDKNLLKRGLFFKNYFRRILTPPNSWCYELNLRLPLVNSSLRSSSILNE